MDIVSAFKESHSTKHLVTRKEWLKSGSKHKAIRVVDSEYGKPDVLLFDKDNYWEVVFNIPTDWVLANDWILYNQ